MSYQVKLQISPVYDLLSSLMAYSKCSKAFDLDNQWVKKVRNELDKDFMAEMDSLSLPFPLIALLIWRCPDNSNLDAVTNWLASLTVGEVFEQVSPFLLENVPNDIGTIKNDVISVFTQWYTKYYKDQELKIQKLLSQERDRFDDCLSNLGPQKTIEMFCNGLAIEEHEELKEVVLVPVYHTKPVNVVFDDYKGFLIILYPVEAPEENDLFPPDRLMRMTRALADEKRLRILKILSSGNRSFTDLVEVMELSKSNLHYHLSLLRTAGLISIHHVPFTNQDKYGIRAGVFDDVKQMLERYVFH
ncbi:winged helix-turn-helix transcriptional regulator [Brevibacillus composti]|uniref:Winged helix-turn-helix transcriptional regulator n=1 Tax=Brevibacillus composti TaxID=2796470 RepID=A0A7T5EJW3_9BACL|nr:winged helix-turn-helix domain-containing protein [Brevibacillus composti]QQE73987.1 winged helix-turn-helix transcriptional regulator [Brevibacillus composti]QUO41071.1 winged helix-turn-helix transcriptional regulator [Brevibacillus composti]